MVAKLVHSRWGYSIGAILLIAGVSGFAGLLLTTIFGFTRDLQQMVVPGDQQLELANVGEYIVFYESSSVVGGRAFSTGGTPVTMDCKIFDETAGEEVPLAQTSMNSRYSVNSREGRSIWGFAITEPGPFRFDCTSSSKGEPIEIVLAVGPNRTGLLFRGIFGAMFAFFVGIGGGIAILVVTFVTRRRTTKPGQPINND